MTTPTPVTLMRIAQSSAPTPRAAFAQATQRGAPLAHKHVYFLLKSSDRSRRGALDDTRTPEELVQVLLSTTGTLGGVAPEWRSLARGELRDAAGAAVLFRHGEHWIVAGHPAQPRHPGSC